MKRTLFLIVICLFVNIILKAQGAEIGYMFDWGNKSNFRIGQGYNQYIESEQHDYFKTLPKSKFNASELQGLRLDPWRGFIFSGIHIEF